MSGKTLLAFGHSHLSALSRAHKTYVEEDPEGAPPVELHWLGEKQLQPNFELVGLGKVKAARQAGEEAHARLMSRLRTPGARDIAKGDKVRVLSEKLETHLRELLAERDPAGIVLACMGNEYNTLGMLRHPEPFDFDLPGSDLPLEEGVTQIPYALMKAQVRATAERNALLFWRFFNDVAGDVPIYMLPPPPPIASEAHIRDFPGAFADRVADYGISPVTLRRKMWLLYCEVLDEAVAGTNTTLVALPPAVFTDGCLSRQFWQSDPTHGNVDYGMVILDHVCSMALDEEAEA
ncbi:hypothetical protein [Salipiger mucosus]|uniref:Uncharacterized protein n=1 Tax=Salipiger mucosus DSM 16094 TaxID=1123237 RepID=S9RWK6_9RHOB|nr:hypothetical protein [Salipiger mucosus]EPX82415.1 hypothetical protein Salmuc_03220 [Salipiger mucosus DSM 16094]